MQTIKLTHPLELGQDDFPPTVMALGYFDGIHKGHQTVINTAIKIADENKCMKAVMTFFPHPSFVLGRIEGPMQYITTLDKKIEYIEMMGVDRLYIVHFDLEFAKLSPQEFIDQYITGLNVKHVVAGFDYTYGRYGKGTLDNLAKYSEDLTYTIIEKVSYNGEKISSTLIRQCILDGEVHALEKYLGRFYSITGRVIDGEKRGRTIGFPTANIEVNGDYLIPPPGVYAVRLFVNETWHTGVCNVGYKPTFHLEETKLSIEVHLFDFDESIYNQKVILEWHLRLRDEKKFSSVTELVSQIKKDSEQANTYFRSRCIEKE